MNSLPDPLQIIQDIVSGAICQAQPGWSELNIHYHVEGGQSELACSYLIAVGGAIHEKPLPAPNDLDARMRQLRAEQSGDGDAPFTSCRLHVRADGRFEASYGYDPVDWDALVTAGWNFPEITKLH